MLGAIFLILVLAGVGGYAVFKMGWKAALAAVTALGMGLYAGGKQVVDAFAVFLGAVF